MLDNEKLPLMVMVKTHFSKATDGDGELVWSALKGYAFADAERAITVHRVEKGACAWRPDIARVRTLAATYHRERTRERYERKPVVEMIRELDRAGTHGKSDIMVILDHFAISWQTVEQSCDDENGRMAARAYIYGHCRDALVQIGIDRPAAEDQAREVVGLMPGEQITKAKLFRQIDPPRTGWDAVQALVAREGEERRQADALDTAPVAA